MALLEDTIEVISGRWTAVHYDLLSLQEDYRSQHGCVVRQVLLVPRQLATKVYQ